MAKLKNIANENIEKVSLKDILYAIASGKLNTVDHTILINDKSYDFSTFDEKEYNNLNVKPAEPIAPKKVETKTE